MKKSLFFAMGVMGVLVFSLDGTGSAREVFPVQPVPMELVRVKAETVKMRQMTGVVKGIDLVEGTLDLKNRRGERSFSISDDTQFKQGRNRLDLRDLKLGARVVVKYKDLGETQEVRIISLKKE